ncbi:MAG: hypothetical protein WKF70_02570 [Chitinophagaceae bacterium]
MKDKMPDCHTPSVTAVRSHLLFIPCGDYDPWDDDTRQEFNYKRDKREIPIGD